MEDGLARLMTRLAALLAAGVLSAGLVACGDSEGEDGSDGAAGDGAAADVAAERDGGGGVGTAGGTPATDANGARATDEEEIAAAYPRFIDAFDEGKPGVLCATLASRLRRYVTTALNPTGDRVGCVEYYRRVIKQDRTGNKENPTPVAVSVSVEGDRAVAKFRNPGSSERYEVPFVKEGGRWRVSGQLAPPGG